MAGYRAFAAHGGKGVFLEAGEQIVCVTLNGGSQTLRSFELEMHDATADTDWLNWESGPPIG